MRPPHTGNSYLQGEGLDADKPRQTMFMVDG